MDTKIRKEEWGIRMGIFLVSIMFFWTGGMLPVHADAVVPETGGVCLCSDGSDPGISGADLANCCNACSGRSGSSPAQGVSIDGASQSCPGSESGASATLTPIAPPRNDGSYGLIDPLGSKSIPTILGGITRVALGFVGSLFLLFFVWGGALWMTAGGEGEKVKTAQKAIRNAVLGMLVVMFAYVLINIIIGISSSVQSRAPAATNRTTPP